ncbi:MAG TPA: ParB/RepB/Spo0J family partition protein [Gemmatimonadales bacterium]|nr:ParB/RepB/Spo0J family partition protein [Gemmatimonadales bacterium]
MAEKKEKARKDKAAKGTRRRKKAEPDSRGIPAGELAAGAPGSAAAALAETIRADGGAVLAVFRDPLGGHWQVLAGLPVAKVEPTPYQRDLSDAHVARLTSAIDRLGRYLDPIIAVPAGAGGYWTPNGHHRLAALKRLGARSVTALVVPEVEVARRILALNTEKAHNLREKALEVSRLAEALVALDDRPEAEFETEFEEPALLTLGLCYRQDGRFAGGAYHPVLKRVEAFLPHKLSKTLATRRERADKLIALDGAVNDAVKALKSRGFESPYLKAFVVARINPLRFQRGAKAEFDETVDRMLASALKFDPSKIKADQLASAGGPPEE